MLYDGLEASRLKRLNPVFLNKFYNNNSDI